MHRAKLDGVFADAALDAARPTVSATDRDAILSDPDLAKRVRAPPCVAVHRAPLCVAVHRRAHTPHAAAVANRVNPVARRVPLPMPRAHERARLHAHRGRTPRVHSRLLPTAGVRSAFNEVPPVCHLVARPARPACPFTVAWQVCFGNALSGEDPNRISKLEMLRDVPRFKALFALCSHGAITGAARELLGSDAQLMKDKFIFKTAGEPASLPPHLPALFAAADPCSVYVVRQARRPAPLQH